MLFFDGLLAHDLKNEPHRKAFHETEFAIWHIKMHPTTGNLSHKKLPFVFRCLNNNSGDVGFLGLITTPLVSNTLSLSQYYFAGSAESVEK